MSRVKIKVLSRLFRHLPPANYGSDYAFVYDPDCSDYDWLVVFDEMPVVSERLRCPHERTILCTWEPVSIKSYSRSYVRQFAYLLTNRPPEAERHPGYRLGRGYFPWFVHDIPALGTAGGKVKELSAVCSAKQMRHTRHHARFELVRAITGAVSGADWFGKGVRPLERKEDALVPYRYHLAIENHIGAHHWTEKFADAILCECLPFYAGDPALTEIFPSECFIQIPLDDPRGAVRIVREALASDEYSRRREAVLEAKRLILGKYNFWSQVIAVIETTGALPVMPHVEGSCIYARKELRRNSLRAALEDGCAHLKRFLGLNLI